MSLEDVKVGDRVWIVDRSSFSHNQSRRLVTITSVTPTRIRSGKEQWQKVQGKNRSQYAGRAIGWESFGTAKSVATPEEIAKLEAEQAQKKADTEAAEARRQREAEEKRERTRRLSEAFGVMFDAKELAGDVITIAYRGHRYEIREIE